MAPTDTTRQGDLHGFVCRIRQIVIRADVRETEQLVMNVLMSAMV